MKTLNYFIYSTLVCAAAACTAKEEVYDVSVANSLDFDRTEIVSVDLTSFNDEFRSKPLVIVDADGNPMIIQTLDANKDGLTDAVLFQPSVVANGAGTYQLKNTGTPSADSLVCFSRFVPERTDDYTWENDKVAFRVYGPTAQRLVEEGQKGGTLSSGVDCWLKKVEYPIIDKWYKEYMSYPNAYHEDTGEGLDNFHVGSSRGCGGLAIKSDSGFLSPVNYVSYQTNTVGALRTSFDLGYANWPASDEFDIATTKHVTLDKGNNLSKIQLDITGTDAVYAGLTLHENDGEVTIDSLVGWISYWQPHGDGTELATALVFSPEAFINSETVISDEKDVSNVYVNLKVDNEQVTYYSGFTWDQSNQFENKEAWHKYLTQFAKRAQAPLQVSLK